MFCAAPVAVEASKPQDHPPLATREEADASAHVPHDVHWKYLKRETYHLANGPSSASISACGVGGKGVPGGKGLEGNSLTVNLKCSYPNTVFAAQHAANNVFKLTNGRACGSASHSPKQRTSFTGLSPVDIEHN